MIIIGLSEILTGFAAVVAAVAEFAGLPEHDFTYDPSHEFRGGGCDKRHHRHGPHYFAEGGRFVGSNKRLSDSEACRCRENGKYLHGSVRT